jgi:lysophospholipase L1-like esterase
MRLTSTLVSAFLCTITALHGASEQARPMHIVLVGDSTVTDAVGWGAAFAKGLSADVRCTNKARGGASTKSYYEGTKLWQEALALKPTHVVIQFGHNDIPGKGPKRETDPKTTFRENLTRYVTEARAAGAKPILVSSVTRRNFLDGKLVDLLADYAGAAKEVAVKEKVAFLDLHARSVAAVVKLGEEGSAELGPMKNGKRDNTHFSAMGAEWAAGLVTHELRHAVPESAAWFR